MSTHENQDEYQDLSWYIVAGFFGEDADKNSAAYIVVQASDLGGALQNAQAVNSNFTAVSALSEQELQGYLEKIREHKNA